MSMRELTCDIVDAGDLDSRYLAGRLSAEEAEAFEAHFFGCNRCWTAVQQGLAVQSAFQPDVPRAAASRPRTLIGRWWGLAAAAGIAAIAIGLSQRSDRPDSTAEDTLRGGSAGFAVVPSSTRTTLTASWPRIAKADVYQVRLYTADGVVLFERETPDTFLSVSVRSLTTTTSPPAAEMLWQVQALDGLRKSVARSDLTQVVIPGP
jgi:Putative zinc-finger